jgi:nucleotide-binding universal stress UspA family protein
MSERVAFSTDGSERAVPSYLIGLDGSGPSAAALRWAFHRAARYQADLTVMHVDAGTGRPETRGDATIENDFATSSALFEAASLVASAYPEIRLATHLARGDASDELARLSHGHDLLVIGTHKTGYLRGRAIGSRGIYIASRTPCSVAVIPDVSLVSRRGVVVGIAPETGSPVALLAAAREAHRLGQPLNLVCVILPQGATLDRHDGFGSAKGRAVLAEAVSSATAMVSGLEVHSRLSSRPIADALLDASRGASLLVLGSGNVHDSRPSMVGLVTHDVLMNINAPVLIARASRVAHDADVEARSAATRSEAATVVSSQ